MWTTVTPSGKQPVTARVSKSFAESVIKTRNDTGSLQPRRQGNRIGGGRLVDHADFLRKRLKDNGNLTNDELCAELERRDVRVHPQTLKRMLKRQGLEAKKNCCRKASSNGRTSGKPASNGPGGAIHPSNGSEAADLYRQSIDPHPAKQAHRAAPPFYPIWIPSCRFATCETRSDPETSSKLRDKSPIRMRKPLPTARETKSSSTTRAPLRRACHEMGGAIRKRLQPDLVSAGDLAGQDRRNSTLTRAVVHCSIKHSLLLSYSQQSLAVVPTPHSGWRH
jgi:transposase